MTLRAQVEHKTLQVIAEVGKIPSVSIECTGSLTDFGLDSLSILVVRETLERVHAVAFSDDTWIGFTCVDEIIDHVVESQGARTGLSAAAPLETGPFPDAIPIGAGRRMNAAGELFEDFEIGMPLTGRMNLAEAPLLKFLGDVRWAHMSALCGEPSKAILNDDGHRLYPTFYYVEMRFPRDRPMASYGENERLTAACTLHRFGGALLDGITYLLPQERGGADEIPYRSADEALAAGVPSVRLSNIFVMQFDGSEWLKKSRPANRGFRRITETAVAPETFAVMKRVQEAGTFGVPADTCFSLNEEPIHVEYDIIPDRDLNGAGLVYFANYPMFLDIAGRRALAEAKHPLPREMLDRRTLVHRKSAYLSNAGADDTIDIYVKPWLENPFVLDHGATGMEPIRLFLEYRMVRRSDGRVMIVSMAEKMIFGMPVEELPFFDELRKAGLS